MKEKMEGGFGGKNGGFFVRFRRQIYEKLEDDGF